MRVLALNAGSSSVKFRLVEFAAGDGVPRSLAGGAIEGLGAAAVLRLEARDGAAASEAPVGARSPAEAVRVVLARADLGQVDATGHRIVHGGGRFVDATLVDGDVLAALEELARFAPLHNPPSLSALRAACDALGSEVPSVAVFDTAFHRSLPEAARTYALPRDIAARHGIRRYGFHGIAHASLVRSWAGATGRPLGGSRLVTLQLGNGCSAAAVSSGLSVDTSMGMTPLEGLVMGTRSGDIDPAVVTHIARAEGLALDAVERLLNEHSGLLGLSLRFSSMKDVLAAAAAGDASSTLAVDVFCHRARRYVGAYLAVLGGADAVVLGGGIGERSAEVRRRILTGFEWCGLELDREANDRVTKLEPGTCARLSAPGSLIEAFAAGTDEETAIARETAERLGWRAEAARTGAGIATPP